MCCGNTTSEEEPQPGGGACGCGNLDALGWPQLWGGARAPQKKLDFLWRNKILKEAPKHFGKQPGCSGKEGAHCEPTGSETSQCRISTLRAQCSQPLSGLGSRVRAELSWERGMLVSDLSQASQWPLCRQPWGLLHRRWGREQSGDSGLTKAPPLPGSATVRASLSPLSASL